MQTLKDGDAWLPGTYEVVTDDRGASLAKDLWWRIRDDGTWEVSDPKASEGAVEGSWESSGDRVSMRVLTVGGEPVTRIKRTPDTKLEFRFHRQIVRGQETLVEEGPDKLVLRKLSDGGQGS